MIARDQHLLARTTLVPSIRIATQEDRTAVGVVKEIIPADDPTMGREEGPSGPIVPHDVIGKEHGGHGGVILECHLSRQVIGEGVAQPDDLVVRTPCQDRTDRRRQQREQRLSVYQPHRIPDSAPGEAESLRMRKGCEHASVREQAVHPQVDAVDVDRIVCHALIESADGSYVTAAIGEVGGIGLEGEVSLAPLPPLDGKVIQRDVSRVLCHQPHPVGKVDRHALHPDPLRVDHRDRRRGA